MATFRCSSLPLLMACARSHAIRFSSPEAENESMALGTEIHAALAGLLRGQGWPAIMTDEARRLAHVGLRAWQALGGPQWPGLAVERQMSHPLGGSLWELTGSSDAWSWDPETRTLRVLDWKLGYATSAEYRWQMLGYAALALASVGVEPSNPPAGIRVEAAVVYLADGSATGYSWDGAGLQRDVAMLHDRLDAIASGGDSASVYTPGLHCSAQHCRPQHCPAHAQALANMVARPVTTLAELRPSEVAEVFAKVQAAAKVVDALKDEIRTYVRERGPVEMGDGMVLDERMQGFGADVETGKAIDVLLDEGWSEGEILSTATLSWSAIKKVAGNRTTGKKGQAIEELEGKMLEAGALTKKVRPVLAVRKAGATTDNTKE